MRVVHNPTFKAEVTTKVADAEAKAAAALKGNSQPLITINRKAKELSIVKFIVHLGLSKGL